METAARAQARLILDHLSELSQSAFQERLNAIYSAHAAKGLLKSGATVRMALRAMDEIASNFITNAVDQVASIAKDIEAFSLISESVETCFSYLDAQIEGVASMASGEPASFTKHNSVHQAAKREFGELRTRLTRQLEIHRFTFTVPTKPSHPSASPANPRNSPKGGRPPAEFWDDMWSAIAFDLYAGDLQPKSQADVERAMVNWIEGHGYSASSSTVRARARRLWDRLEAEK